MDEELVIVDIILLVFFVIFGPVTAAFLFHRFAGSEPKSLRFWIAFFLSSIAGGTVVAVGSVVSDYILLGHLGKFGLLPFVFAFLIFLLISFFICTVLAGIKIINKLKRIDEAMKIETRR